MKQNGLNLKQQAFADFYIELNGNATQAAIKAGYSKKTARSQGQRLLTNVDIKKYIEDRIEEIKDEKILKQKDILVLLSEIAAGLVPEVKEVVTRKAEYVDNPNNDKQTMVYNEYAEMLNLPTKNNDRIKALETLGKFYKLWTDKQQVEVSGAVEFIDDIGSDLDDED